MNQHTPGPWTFDKDAHCAGGYIRTTKGLGTAACKITTSGHSYGEAIANARLIAAAPELLAALKYQLDRPDVDRGFLQDIIAKAEAA